METHRNFWNNAFIQSTPINLSAVDIALMASNSLDLSN